MHSNVAEVTWSDEQWSRVHKTVQTEAQKARVAAQFLPTTVTPDASAVAVPDLLLDVNLSAGQPPTRRLDVDSTPATFFTSFAVNVTLTTQEMADSQQSAALVKFRRAANIIARLEDALIFSGQSAAGAVPPGALALPQVYEIGSGGRQPGLVAMPPLNASLSIPCSPRQDITLPAPTTGDTLAGEIFNAIGLLEAAGHNRPFACVLGQTLFSHLHTPTGSLVLPRDRVVPFVEGPILRSSTIPNEYGIVVALGGSPIEIVASSELHVRFIQVSPEPRFIFRVAERIALRVTDWTAIVELHPRLRRAQ